MMIRTVLAAGAVALLASLLAAATASATMPTEQGFALQRRCFEELSRGKSRDVVCEYPTLLTDEERADLVKATRGYLKDAHCVVSIRIERARVAQAIFAPDLVFDVPPQPVKCQIETSSTVLPITATFSPRVVIKGGEATEATPNLGNVVGINHYLAWPVLQYVNRSASIRGHMLRMINQYRNIAAAARSASAR
jgi:hypothetical protein